MSNNKVSTLNVSEKIVFRDGSILDTAGSSISVDYFGASGDGVTNNKTALQNAINSLYSTSGGALFFPKGIYYWSGEIGITGSNITLFGEEGSILTCPTNEMSRKITISGCSDVNIRNLIFDYKGTTGSPYDMFYGIRTGFVNTFNARNINITNCEFYNSRNSSIYLGSRTKYVNINNNYFSGTFCDIYSLGGENTTEPNAYFNITDNIFDASQSWGEAVIQSAAIKLSSELGLNEPFRGQLHHVIDGNTITKKSQIAIELWNLGASNIVTNNNIRGTQMGISMDNQADCVIMGNTISQVSWIGLEAATLLRNCSYIGNTVFGYTGYDRATRTTEFGFLASNQVMSGIILSNNIFEGCKYYGADVQRVQNCIVSNNFFRGNYINLMLQETNNSQVLGNFFGVSETGSNTTKYHLVLDALYSSTTGYLISDNRFTGPTENEGIYFCNGNGGLNPFVTPPNTETGYKFYDVVLKDNATDTTCTGLFGSRIFLSGTEVLKNYAIKNNYMPSGGTKYNSILNSANTLTNPYNPSDVKQGISYYGTYNYQLPTIVTGNGIWVCAWSGNTTFDASRAQVVPLRVKYNSFSDYNNNATALEVYAGVIGYNYAGMPHSLKCETSAQFFETNVKQVKTVSYEVLADFPNNIDAAVWFQLQPSDSGDGRYVEFSFSEPNKLTAPIATYSEPADTNGTAKLFFGQGYNQAEKISRGLVVGNTSNAGIGSNYSGRLDIWGSGLYITGKVGVGVDSPLSPIHISNNSVPATGGRATGGLLISNGTSGPSINIGAYDTNSSSTSYGWVQSAYANNGATSTVLALNPVGGRVNVRNTTNDNLHTLIVSGYLRISQDNGPAINLYSEKTVDTNVLNGLVSQFFWNGGATVLGSYTGAPLYFITSNATRAAISADGKFGIGTSAPTRELVVYSTGGNSTLQIASTGTTDNTSSGFHLVSEGFSKFAYVIQRQNANLYFRTNNINRVCIDSGGNVSIGGSSPTTTLAVVGNPDIYNGLGNIRITTAGIGDVAGRGAFFQLNTLGNASAGCLETTGYFDLYAGGSSRVIITSGGNVGIGTNTPTAQLHTTSTVRFANFGAGTATFDANGNISSVSDERLKNISGLFLKGLESVTGITPINFTYRPESNLDTSNVYAGFSAQQVANWLPEAVFSGANGYLSFSDRPIMAALVNAVKQLTEKVEKMEKVIQSYEKLN